MHGVVAGMPSDSGGADQAIGSLANTLPIRPMTDYNPESVSAVIFMAASIVATVVAALMSRDGAEAAGGPDGRP